MTQHAKRIAFADAHSRALAQALDGLQLGCDCRGDVGVVHRACAERWFARKGDLRCEVCAAAVPNVRLLPPPPGSRAAAAAAVRARAAGAPRRAARRISRRAADGSTLPSVAMTRAQLYAIDTAAKNIFPLSLFSGGAVAVYFILAMRCNVIIAIALAALLSTVYCALACQEVICHAYDVRARASAACVRLRALALTLACADAALRSHGC